MLETSGRNGQEYSSIKTGAPVVKEDSKKQSPADFSGSIEPDRSAIIDHIYQVAIDPERYETLLDLWEEKIAPFRRGHTLSETSTCFEDMEIENHAERAGIFLDRIDHGGHEGALASIVDAIDPSAAFVLDHDMKVIAANSAARSIFDARLGVLLDNTRLEPEECAKLAQESRDILDSQRPKTSLIRFRSIKANRTIVFRLKKVEIDPGERPAVLAVSSELAWPDALGQTLQEAFGLTPTEAEIVRRVTQGSSLKEIAERRYRSLDTIKTQLRSVLTKTDTHTQSELVRLTLSLMDVVSATETRAADVPAISASQLALEPKEFLTLRRRDGSRADHLILGEPDGRPILYFPLDYGLTRWPASAEAYAREKRMKVIVPIRPGYGHSDNVNHHSELLDVVLEDTLALLDHYGIRRCPVICMSADAFFAYHFARRHPGRINVILNCAPGFPIFLPQQYERMEKWHRFILANARHAPSILPFLVKAGFSLARRIGKRGFVHAVYGNSPADVHAFEQPEVHDAMVTGSEVCLSDWHSAHRAFSNEVIIQQQDWRELVHGCEIPVHCWYGDDDPQVPPGSMKEIIQEFPRVHYHKLENAGQLLFFAHWREILPEVEKWL